jgi:hypothetical protein
MPRKMSLARRFVYVAIFLTVGAAALLTIAHIMDPPARCEERGGTWVIDGRYCDEVAVD